MAYVCATCLLMLNLVPNQQRRSAVLAAVHVCLLGHLLMISQQPSKYERTYTRDRDDYSYTFISSQQEAGVHSIRSL